MANLSFEKNKLQALPAVKSPAPSGAHYETLFENGKGWYSTKEASALLGMSVQFVRDAFDSQELMGQEITSRGVSSGRRIKLIHRDCLLVYLMQTANYSAADFILRMKKLLLRRPASELEEIRVWLDKTRVMGRN